MKILVVAPHADDETLGVGGTIARRAAEGHEVTVAVMTGHGEKDHPLWPREYWNLIRKEAAQAWDLLGVSHVIFDEIPAVTVSQQPLWQLNQATMNVLEQVRPDVLYVPFLYDMHKDHRELFHSFSVAWRPTSSVGRQIKEIYTYEVISETHWNAPYLEPGFLPNVWVDISDHLEKKLQALHCFRSQMGRFPNTRSVESAKALAQWRGTQMNMSAAEAFVAIRLLD